MKTVSVDDFGISSVFNFYFFILHFNFFITFNVTLLLKAKNGRR